MAVDCVVLISLMEKLKIRKAMGLAPELPRSKGQNQDELSSLGGSAVSW